MTTTVFRTGGKQLQLTVEIGRGGEGTIYESPQNQGECAKIYTKGVSSEIERKVGLMVRDPPKDPAYDTRKHRSIAWPTDLLYSDSRQLQLVGFLMPKIDLVQFNKALCYIDRQDRTKRLLGGFTWKHLFTAAFNLVSSVAAIHERGYRIGDLNESNIMIAPTTLIVLIDCDSFQVTDHRSGKVYRCPVGKPEYTAPELQLELQGKSYLDVNRTLETDNFALGVILFQLLMEGTHPYQAKGALVADAPSTEAKILKGHFPYTVTSKGLAPPDHAPPFDVLHPDIQKLFHQCFSEGHRDPQRRPTALDWFDVLKRLAHRFKECQANDNHLFLDHCSSCPWCGIARSSGRDPFPSLLGQQVALNDPTNTLASIDNRLEYLRSHAAAVVIDGMLTTEEDHYLTELGKRLQIPSKEVHKVIQEEAQKAQIKGVTSGQTSPRLEISKTRFEFLDLRLGTVTPDNFTISNTGGGVLQGSIISNRRWLKLPQSQIDITKHKQDIPFVVETAGLPLGLKETGTIEIRSNGGTQHVQVELSVEIPDAAISRFRQSITYAGLLAGGLLGSLTYTLLPAQGWKEATAVVAGLVAILAAAVAHGKNAGFAGGIQVLIGAFIVSLVLGKWSPLALSIVSWAVTYGMLLNLAARSLFIRNQKGGNTAFLGAVISGLSLAVTIVIASTFLETRIEAERQRAEASSGKR